MGKEEIKLKSRELIKKLTEKFDKCQWKKSNSQISDIYVLSFENIGSIHIDKQLLIVFNKDGTPILENVLTEQERDHLILWEKINENDRIYKDKYLDILIKELDSIK